MKKSFIPTLCTICLIVIVLAGAFFMGDGNKKDNVATPSQNTEKNTGGIWDNATYTEDQEFGTGKNTFSVKVIVEKNDVTFTIHTDKETVGDALMEHKLIDGEKGPYGLYVKYVNGIKADYDENQTYWSFNKDGETLLTGVDTTPVENGVIYELVYTK